MGSARRPAAPFGSTTEQFIEAKIELAITFARLVRTERAFGQEAAAHDLAEKAMQAHVQAEEHVQDLERHGVRFNKLRARLGQLQAELARLDQEVKAA